MDFQRQQNLMLAAALARKAGRGGVARDVGRASPVAAGLMQAAGVGGGDQLDPLEAALVQHMFSQREARRQEEVRQREARHAWERSLQQQAAMHAREDRLRQEDRGLRQAERGEERDWHRELADQQTTKRDTERKEDRAWELDQWHRRRYDELQSTAAALEAQEQPIPAMLQAQLDFYAKQLGLEPAKPVRHNGTPPKDLRRGYEEAAQAAGDVAAMEAIRRARTAEELQAIPFVQARRNQLADPILDDAAKQLNTENPAGLINRLWKTYKPWQESGSPFSKAYWSKNADNPLERAKMLWAADPTYRQHGITPEEIVDRYVGRGRFAGAGID